jgi:hypothetical protein
MAHDGCAIISARPKGKSHGASGAPRRFPFMARLWRMAQRDGERTPAAPSGIPKAGDAATVPASPPADESLTPVGDLLDEWLGEGGR